MTNTKDYSNRNAEVVLAQVQAHIAELEEANKKSWMEINGARFVRQGWGDNKRTMFRIGEVCDKLSIFDWWNDNLSKGQLKQMETFLKQAIKLGFTGYVCFKVGAAGCAHGMWAHKNESTNGYSPEGDVLFHSFRSGDNYFDMELGGKWMRDILFDRDDEYEFTLAEVKQAMDIVANGITDEEEQDVPDTVYTKEQINEAIYTVLTTQFKKQALEAFKIVKAAGYEYVKGNGRFSVRNKETGRNIYIDEGGWYNHYYVMVHAGWHEGLVTKFEGPDRDLNVKEKFDFVGCLDKPVNQTWYDMINKKHDPSEAIKKFHRLRDKKSYVKYREDDIQRIKKQMEKLQQDLEKAIQYKAEYEQDVEDCRKELGLA